MTETPFLNQPLPFRVLIDEAMKNVRRHFRAIYPGVALPLVLLSVPMMVVQARSMGSFMNIDPESPAPPPSGFLAGFGGIFLISVLMGFLFGLAVAVMIAAAVDAVAGRPVSMRRSWTMMLRPRALGTMILVGLACIGAAMFCFFPAIYVGLILSMVVPVMVEEQIYGTNALRRSASLITYDPRLRFTDNPIVKVFLLTIVVFVLSYAVNMLVQMPFMLAQQIIMFRSLAEGESANPGTITSAMIWLQVPASILGTLTGMAIHLYTSFGLGLLFFDVRRRKEGEDLETALDELAGLRTAPSGADVDREGLPG